VTNGHRHFGDTPQSPEPTTLSLSDLLRAVVERDGFACVRCGNGVAFGFRSVHHRKLGDRSLNEPWNLITLCGSGTTGCHGWVHGVKVAGLPQPSRRECYTAGWIVPKHHAEPWVIPVLYAQPLRTGYYLLEPDLTVTSTA
jgi:hypothetical protein